MIMQDHNTDVSDFRFSPKPNNARLIRWRHWEREALEEAGKRGTLILLSISAVWCHWCHVMDETTYSDLEVIDFINRNLIPIRIDADLRPDIDSLYNQGGWPSTLILTPDGEILYGGTYISPQDMRLTLSKILEIHSNEKGRIDERISQIKAEKESAEIKASEPRCDDISRILSMIRALTTADTADLEEHKNSPTRIPLISCCQVIQRPVIVILRIS